MHQGIIYLFRGFPSSSRVFPYSPTHSAPTPLSILGFFWCAVCLAHMCMHACMPACMLLGSHGSHKALVGLGSPSGPWRPPPSFSLSFWALSAGPWLLPFSRAGHGAVSLSLAWAVTDPPLSLPACHASCTCSHAGLGATRSGDAEGANHPQGVAAILQGSGGSSFLSPSPCLWP